MGEDNEFMVIPEAGEPRSKTLEQFAKDVLADPEYQRSVEVRAKAGKLTPAESRMLLEAGRRQQQQDEANKPKSKTQTMMEAATPTERRVMVNVALRAKGEPEIPFMVPGTNTYMTFAEAMAIVAEVYKP